MTSLLDFLTMILLAGLIVLAVPVWGKCVLAVVGIGALVLRGCFRNL